MTDLADWIVRITHRIWEEGDVAHIQTAYAPDVRVWTDWGPEQGHDAVIAGTLQTMAAFPDLRLYADAVLVGGDAARGWVTSHRLVKVAHHTGPSKLYGPPTGRRVTAWNFAVCHVREGRIVEEWLTANAISWHRQLGHDVRAEARRAAERCATLEAPARGEGLVGAQTGPAAPVVDALATIWNRRDLSALERAYAPGARVHAPSDRELRGRGAIRGFVVSILAALPDLVVELDEAFTASAELVALRWRAFGTHLGDGPWGAPTGRHLRLWGASQLRVRAGRIEEEWLMFNELAVLGQVLRAEPFPGGGLRSKVHRSARRTTGRRALTSS